MTALQDLALSSCNRFFTTLVKSQDMTPCYLLQINPDERVI